MKIQTSKLILLVDFSVAIILAVVIIRGTLQGIDMSPVSTFAVGWDAQLAAAVGFYYWKAKNENRSKHAMILVEKLAEKYGIDSVISLSNTILKD